MKFYAAIVVAILSVFSAAAQKEAPKGYAAAPTLSITGDFDGDGKADTLTQFVTDSLGNRLDYILDADDWETTIPLYNREGYRNAFSLNGTTQPSLVYHPAVGLSCLINLGNVNTTPGDEIALVPFLYDSSNLNTCHIYSYCNDTWKEVFSFRVNESAFYYTGDTEPVFMDIPGALEQRDGAWYYLDALEEDTQTPEEATQMKPLVVADCRQATQSYVPAPTLSITGDFDGDGKQDTLTQFVTDSQGNRLDTILTSDDLTQFIGIPYKMGYRSNFTLNGANTTLPVTDIELLCLINLGNINKTKGDEIALVALVRDYSALGHCTIYSYCNKQWVATFSFEVNETVFDYEGDVRPVFTNIPGVLEKQNGKWRYFVWFDENFIDKNGKNIMKPLQVKSCK